MLVLALCLVHLAYTFEHTRFLLRAKSLYQNMSLSVILTSYYYRQQKNLNVPLLARIY